MPSKPAARLIWPACHGASPHGSIVLMEKNLSAMDPRTLKSEHSLMTEISAQEVSTHFEMSAQEMSAWVGYSFVSKWRWWVLTFTWSIISKIWHFQMWALTFGCVSPKWVLTSKVLFGVFVWVPKMMPMCSVVVYERVDADWGCLPDLLSETSALCVAGLSGTPDRVC